jgi:hypothetical protein
MIVDEDVKKMGRDQLEQMIMQVRSVARQASHEHNNNSCWMGFIFALAMAMPENERQTFFDNIVITLSRGEFMGYCGLFFDIVVEPGKSFEYMARTYLHT